MFNIFNELKVFNDRHLANIVYSLYMNHAELQEELEQRINLAKERKENDSTNNKLNGADFPYINEDKLKKGFNIDSLNEIDQDSFNEKIKDLSFLTDRDKPNLLLFGKPERGKELLSVLIGRAACKKGYKTNFIRYEYLLDIFRGDGYFDPANEPYSTLAKSECLIIDDFAGTIERDKMVISELQRFFRFRQANHLKGKGKKKRPRSNIILSYYPFHKWNDYLADEDEKACYFKSMIEDHGTMIKVDDSVEYQTLESRFWY